jgi:alpha-L-fucosidase
MLQPAPTQGDTRWFTHDRFGMFIHWGLYALPARHEWVKSREKITDEDYRVYFEHFNPDLYDPGAWAASAKAAGMKYVVLTAKHHEGFCLWDSQQTDYKVTNTPYGQDLLGLYVAAFREAGLRVGFYYSLLDWHHPDFPIDVFHPLRDLESEEVARLNEGRDMGRYAAYMREQVRELLTTHSPDIIWYDFSYPDHDYRGLPGKGREQWESEALLALTRELRPEIIINNRLDLPGSADIHTPEQFQPREWVHVDGQPVVWETCQTFSGSWGYHRDETTWKSPAQLIEMLVNTVSCGGNLLMNVGPTGRGTFDSRAEEALRVYGEWLELHGRSIYGCTQSDFSAPQGCRFTQNGKALYLHVFNWPFRHLHLDGFAGRVAYAQLLNDASEVKRLEPGKHGEWSISETAEGTLTLELPVVKPDVVVPVIELFLR